MKNRPNQFEFDTNRDRDAFGEVLKRTDLSYAKGELYRVEWIADPIETDCEKCRCGHGNVRLVWSYGKRSGVGSDDYCLHCFYRATREWLEDLQSAMKESYRAYRSEKKERVP